MGSPLIGQEISERRIKIKGMICTSCSHSVDHVLKMVDGVKNAIAGLVLEEANVQFDPILIDIKRISEAGEAAGFGADLISSRNDMNKVHIKLEGIDSRDDVNAIVSSLNLADGVNHVEMDLTEEHKVTVSYDPNDTGPRYLSSAFRQQAVLDLVCMEQPCTMKEMEKPEEIRVHRSHVLLSCVFSVLVLVFSMVLPMLPPYSNSLSRKVH